MKDIKQIAEEKTQTFHGLIKVLGEIKKQVESIRRNAEKINEHTWEVYKEQILSHVEEAEQTIKKEV